jgi:hypothetical protein
MKTSLDKQQFFTTVLNQRVNGNDYLLDTKHVNFNIHDNQILVSGIDKGDPNRDFPQSFTISEHAHSQLSAHLGINKKYYNKMLTEAPDLLITNIQRWFNQEASTRMFRTMDIKDENGITKESTIRAFLSRQYFRIHNSDIFASLQPVFEREFPGLKFESMHVSDNYMYFKCFWGKAQRELRQGDVMEAGFMLAHSETGCRALEIIPMTKRLICTNGMVHTEHHKDHGFYKRHTGSILTPNKGTFLMSGETQKLEQQAILSGVVDGVRHVLKGEWLNEVVAQAQNAMTVAIEKPTEVVEKLSNTLAFSENETKMILEQFLKNEEQTQFGLFNAVTRVAQDIESYDRATEFETLGSKVLNMSARALIVK